MESRMEELVRDEKQKKGEGLKMVEHSGFEPLTSTMPLWRSTN